MFTPYPVVHNEKTKLWLVSDTHFGHNKDFILTPRRFNTVEQHDATLIKTWNDLVDVNDTVVHLGDFIVGAQDQTYELGEHLLHTLQGNKIFLWGNHNAYLKTLYRNLTKEQYGKQDIEVYPLTTRKYGSPVTFMGNNLLLEVKTDRRTQLVFCSHFAHRLWFDSNKGVWHCSGHSHSNDPQSQPDFLDCKRLDVGIENFGGPVSFDKIAEVMNKKQQFKTDHH